MRGPEGELSNTPTKRPRSCGWPATATRTIRAPRFGGRSQAKSPRSSPLPRAVRRRCRRLARFRIRGCSSSAPTLAEPVSGFYGPKISGGSGKIGDLSALRPFSAWSTRTPSEASWAQAASRIGRIRVVSSVAPSLAAARVRCPTVAGDLRRSPCSDCAFRAYQEWGAAD